jgi:hypothetical protein
MRIGQPVGRFVREEVRQALHGDADLAEASGEIADGGHRLSDQAEVEDKEGKIAHREGPCTNRLAGQQEN